MRRSDAEKVADFLLNEMLSFADKPYDAKEKVTEWIEENFADRPAYEVVAVAKKTMAKTREGKVM